MNPIGFDIETTGLNPWTEHLVSFALGEKSKIETFMVYHSSFVDEESISFWRERYPEGVKALKKAKYLVGHNLNFDLLWAVLKFKLPLEDIDFFDTMVAASLLGMERVDLARVSKKYLGETKVDVDSKNIFNIPIEDVVRYNERDVKLVLELKPILEKELEEAGLWPLFEFIKDLIRVLIDLEIHGARVDRELLLERKEILEEEISALEKSLIDTSPIAKIDGKKVNFNSPKQMAIILYHEKGWGLPIISKTIKTGNPSTAEGTLRNLLLEEIPEEAKLWITQYLLLKEKSSLHSKFFKGVLKRLVKHGENDYRVHSWFHPTKFKLLNWQGGTVSGRLSSSDPNLQNIPKDIFCREIFIPPSGLRMFLADYSQIELRSGAFLAKAESMLKVFRENKDVHTYSLAKMMGVSYEEAVKRVENGTWYDERRFIKTFNFALIYGAGVSKLHETLLKDFGKDWPYETISLRRKAWMRDFPEFWNYKSVVETIITNYGYVKTPTGRTREFPPEKLTSDHVWKAHKEGLNFLVQALASDIALFGMVFLHEELKRWGGRVVLPVHDSADGYYDPKKLKKEDLIEICETNMVQKVEAKLEKDFGIVGVPIAVEVETDKPHWS